MNYKIITLCDSMYSICDNCKISCIKQIPEIAKMYDYIIIDISQVESMNSTLLSSVLEFKDKIIICGPTPVSVNILSILGVEKFVKVFHNVDIAVKYVEEGSSIRLPTVSHRH